MTTPPPPPPGWYPDPSDGAERYWDGTTWGPALAPPPEGPELRVPDLPDFDAKDSPKELMQRWGGLVGLIVVGCLFPVISYLLDIKFLQYGFFACLIGAVYWFSRVRKEPADPGELATTPQSDSARQRVFQEYLSRYIAATEGRVESSTAYTAVVVHGESVNHILHLLLSMATCGVWLPIWFVLAMTGGEYRTVLAVDQCGNITTTD